MKMKKTVLLVILLVFCGSLVFAQTYKGKARIKGLVCDEDGNPIEDVTVKLYSIIGESGFEVKTDAEGQWVASWIRGGAWNVDFEKIGYMPKKINIDVKSYGRNPDVEVTLEKVEGLVITPDLQEELIKGNSLYEQGQYKEAIAVFEQMLLDNPDAYIINLNIGNAYFQMEEYDTALNYYQKVLDADPDNVRAKLQSGNALANQGDSEGALEWYNKIDFEKIDDSTVLYNIGTNYYNQGQFADALKYYERSLELDENYIDAVYQAGLANLSLGENQEAIKYFELYLEKDSDSQRASQVRGFLDYLK
jgi:tetratricopeptide (TPR) repeat protein